MAFYLCIKGKLTSSLVNFRAHYKIVGLFYCKLYRTNSGTDSQLSHVIAFPKIQTNWSKIGV